MNKLPYTLELMFEKCQREFEMENDMVWFSKDS